MGSGRMSKVGGGGRRMLRVATGLTAVALVAGTTAAVGGPASAASSSHSITLYSGQHVQTTNDLVNAFEKKTGITVNVRANDEDTFTNQIVAEGSRSPADVFLTENSPPLEVLQGKGLLSPVKKSTLANTPTKFNSPTGHWVGVSARVSVMVYNTTLLKRSQLPTSVMQLASAKWQGKVGLAPGETDFQPIVTSVDRAHGQAATEKWLTGLKANAGSHSYPSNETLVSEVNQGQVALGLIKPVLLVPAAGRDRAVQGPFSHRLLRPPRRRLRARRLGGGGPEVQYPPGRRPEVPGLPHQQAGPRDHRPQ